jgi:hypothetical protein
LFALDRLFFFEKLLDTTVVVVVPINGEYTSDTTTTNTITNRFALSVLALSRKEQKLILITVI